MILINLRKLTLNQNGATLFILHHALEQMLVNVDDIA